MIASPASVASECNSSSVVNEQQITARMIALLRNSNIPNCIQE